MDSISSSDYNKGKGDPRDHIKVPGATTSADRLPQAIRGGEELPTIAEKTAARIGGAIGEEVGATTEWFKSGKPGLRPGHGDQADT